MKQKYGLKSLYYCILVQKVKYLYNNLNTMNSNSLLYTLSFYIRNFNIFCCNV